MIVPDHAPLVLRAADYRRAPWKNGGGETSEIAIFPAGATIETFDWRISMATVASDGPFSVFAGVDRTLCILDGSGVWLTVAGQSEVRLNATSDPFSFSGDLDVHSRLIDGTVTDLNVMTRRGRCRHRVTRVRLHPGETYEAAGDVRAVFCESGTLVVHTGAQHQHLRPRDTVLRQTTDNARWSIDTVSEATAYLVTI